MMLADLKPVCLLQSAALFTTSTCLYGQSAAHSWKRCLTFSRNPQSNVLFSLTLNSLPEWSCDSRGNSPLASERLMGIILSLLALLTMVSFHCEASTGSVEFAFIRCKCVPVQLPCRTEWAPVVPVECLSLFRLGFCLFFFLVSQT